MHIRDLNLKRRSFRSYMHKFYGLMILTWLIGIFVFVYIHNKTCKIDNKAEEKVFYPDFTLEKCKLNEVFSAIKEKGKPDDIQHKNNLLQQYHVRKNPIGHLNESIEMLLIIKSFVGNIGQRSAIRRTWGQNQKGVIKTIFVLSYQEEYQDYVDREESVYKDILQFDLPDTYRNLVYKTMSTLLWFANSRIDPTYVHFLDDDRLVNTTNLINFAMENLSSPDFKMYGYMVTRGKPVRDPNSRHHVSIIDYPYEYYPPYLIGGTILTTPKVVRRLAISVPFVNIFEIEDVLVGIIAHLLNLKVIHYSGFLPEFVEGFKLKDRISCPNYKCFSDQMEGWRSMNL